METSKTSGGRESDRLSPSKLRAVHEQFVAGQLDLDSIPLRRVVAESWRRSLATGVDPDVGGGAPPTAVALERMRSSHPLAPALPVIRRLLVDDASDAGVVVAVTAADGTLLWVEGDRDACRKAERMNFVPGADWSERGAGTNAPGTALALDAELQINGSEHFARVVQPWTCTAVPVHDPATGALIGAIDLTGGIQIASPQTLALVRATAVAVENQLALWQLSQATPAPLSTARLTVLGAEAPSWRGVDARGELHTVTLTGRHADILVLLSRHREGFSADHLAMLLDEKDLDVVTIRAEMSRLRRVIGAEFIDSRPYRLLSPIDSDMGDVFDALLADDVDGALAHYSGELLPRSVSPGVARLRRELSACVRAAVLSSGNLALLRRWLELPQSRDDRDCWLVLYNHAPPGSAVRALARGHLEGLDRDLT